MPFFHNLPDWPKFEWDREVLEPLVGQVRHRQGRLFGRMEGLGFSLRQEASLQSMTEEVVKSSAIEGEALDEEQVRSSIARRLGIEAAGLASAERDVEGVVDMMLDATQHFGRPLDDERLFGWHAALFPTGRSGLTRIRVGGWRDDTHGPMQVVSGAIGRERVHFEAPAAGRVEQEMRQFLAWTNDPPASVDPVVRAGIAHLWFVTIHPFDDGNGRIARAVAEMMLARSEGSSQRFYSMSAQIRAERKRYYDVLEATQRNGLDITAWLGWFLECLDRALARAEQGLSGVLAKVRYWEKFGAEELSARQRRVLNRVLDGFDGKLTTGKWAALGKCSQDTAARDIHDLFDRGLLVRGPGGGRSTHYLLTGFNDAAVEGG